MRTAPGSRQVGHLGEAGQVEIPHGDGHAVGAVVGVGQYGTQVVGELQIAAGGQDGHCGFPLQVVVAECFAKNWRNPVLELCTVVRSLW